MPRNMGETRVPECAFEDSDDHHVCLSIDLLSSEETLSVLD